MNISRRSFLKLAALSTAAVAVSASMTGCATPWTPSLTITYQEVAAKGAELFTTTTNPKEGHKQWEKGKKVAVSGEKFVTKTLQELDGYKTEDQIINKITAALKEDYEFTDKKVTLVTADPEINKSFNTYAITIQFKVENA